MDRRFGHAMRVAAWMAVLAMLLPCLYGTGGLLRRSPAGPTGRDDSTAGINALAVMDAEVLIEETEEQCETEDRTSSAAACDDSIALHAQAGETLSPHARDDDRLSAVRQMHQATVLLI